MSDNPIKIYVRQPDGSMEGVDIEAGKAIDLTRFKDVFSEGQWNFVEACEPYPLEEVIMCRVTGYDYDEDGNIIAIHLVAVDEEE